MQKEKNTKSKILLFDIETSPNLSYTWGKWQQDVVRFKKQWEVLSVAYKWLDEEKVHCIARCDKGLEKEKNLIKKVWELFDKADILVAHHGDSFDIKKIKAKFLEHNLTPPSPYKTVDTKKLAKSGFSFNSNQLDDIGQTLNLGKKLPTGGFDMWLGCMAGEKKAWKQMKDYNEQDVILLEKVYLKLRGWAKHHPDVSQFDRSKCKICSHPDLQRRGYERRRSGFIQKLCCKSCGAQQYGEKVHKEKPNG